MSSAAPQDLDGAPDLPVTVSFTRRTDPAQAPEMTAWIRAGLTLAEQYPGFLGGGWVRPREGSDEWHVLVRFGSSAELARWEGSPRRGWWLASGAGLTEVTRTERRTGIEGWFDDPQATEHVHAAPAAPPRWKQATTIWLGFFPLNLLATLTVGRALAGLPVVLRVLVTTVLLTPVMTYLVLPWITRRLQWWLQGRRFRERHRP